MIIVFISAANLLAGCWRGRLWSAVLYYSVTDNPFFYLFFFLAINCIKAAEVSLHDSHRVEQCNIKFHIGELVAMVEGRGRATVNLVMINGPGPLAKQRCSPSLLAINKNIYISVFIFFFLFTQYALSRGFHSYPPFTPYTHSHTRTLTSAS